MSNQSQAETIRQLHRALGDLLVVMDNFPKHPYMLEKAAIIEASRKTYHEVTPKPMKALKPIDFCNISGRRWFQKSNGNTYFSVRLSVNHGEFTADIPYEYGYGDQYRDAAIKLLIDAGYYASHDDFYADQRGDFRDLFHIDVVDVERKKDL